MTATDQPSPEALATMQAVRRAIYENCDELHCDRVIKGASRHDGALVVGDAAVIAMHLLSMATAAVPKAERAVFITTVMMEIMDMVDQMAAEPAGALGTITADPIVVRAGEPFPS
jgi:hypothetical protein